MSGNPSSIDDRGSPVILPFPILPRFCVDKRTDRSDDNQRLLTGQSVAVFPSFFFCVDPLQL